MKPKCRRGKKIQTVADRQTGRQTDGRSGGSGAAERSEYASKKERERESALKRGSPLPSTTHQEN